MKQNKLKKYIKELDGLITHSREDIKLIAMLTNRLEQILLNNKPKHLSGFILTLEQMRDFSWTASDYKFLDKVVGRLKKIAKNK